MTSFQWHQILLHSSAHWICHHKSCLPCCQRMQHSLIVRLVQRKHAGILCHLWGLHQASNLYQGQPQILNPFGRAGRLLQRESDSLSLRKRSSGRCPFCIRQRACSNLYNIAHLLFLAASSIIGIWGVLILVPEDLVSTCGTGESRAAWKCCVVPEAALRLALHLLLAWPIRILERSLTGSKRAWGRQIQGQPALL